jgi:hypothetical protein
MRAMTLVTGTISSCSPENDRGRQLRRPYFKNHHHMAAATAVMATDIATEVAISLTHSKFDTLQFQPG